MAQGKPMDRLICGDVGYGKTEIAIRAAFKAVDAGKQVAVLVPTTILAEQHHRSFAARMAEFPFTIEAVNRFRPKSEIRDVLKRSAAGAVDILIGTHRILQKDVAFKDLGLVIIDEEQRFGVEDKEWLKTLRSTVDVLTLSATPIPRTLHMSLLGIRDISNLETPPPDRKAIETRVTRFDAETIKRAIHRELNRDGQVFFVHNRIYDIESIADKIQSIVPEAKIAIGHGQMTGEQLERTMIAFIKKKYDILVATTIIESGLDIPNVNTIFINEADKYGLADLHQLRGRVGRYKHRAYAYLLLESNKSVSPNAVKRLKAIEEFTTLGAGFKIALRDLEIRGAGNILGAEQSGHIESVGYELYCSLLESAARSAHEPAGEAALRLLGRAGLAGLFPPRLRPRRAAEAGALPAPGTAPLAQPPGRFPQGAGRPLRPPAPPGREPAHRGRDPHPGRRLEARPDPCRVRPVRRPDLSGLRADRSPRPPTSQASPDRRRQEGVCPARRRSRQDPRHRRADPHSATDVRLNDRGNHKAVSFSCVSKAFHTETHEEEPQSPQ